MRNDVQDDAWTGGSLGDGDLADDSVDPVTLGNPYHLPEWARIFLGIVAVGLAVAMTALFLQGAINSFW